MLAGLVVVGTAGPRGDKMEPITIGVGAFSVVSLVGALLAIYYKLKGSLTEEIKNISDQRLDRFRREATTIHNTQDLKIQALELTQTNLDANTVKKEVFADFTARLSHIEITLQEVKRLLQAQNK